MYESFYKLNAKPFQLNPDPRFFFESKGHKRAMAYLEYGLTLGEGFIVITGDVGAGKTMLVRNLFKKLERENVVATQLVTTQLEADDTLRMVAAGFGLEHEGANKATLLKRIETFLQGEVRRGKRALLVVDEAQNLSPKAVEELRMLSNFQMNDRSLIQSFLLGQPEFRRTLQSEEMQQLKQRVIASYHLGPMEAPETRAYVAHRLDLAGWRGDPAIADGAYELIHQYSGGVPRRINTLCDRLLLFGYLEELHNLDLSAVEQVIEDLQKEVAHARPAAASQVNGFDKHLPSEVEAAGDYQEMVGRLEAMDKTLNQVLTMTRRLLFHTTERS